MDDLSSLSSQELNAAVSAITADDPDIGRLAGEIRQAVTAVNRESRTAIDAAEALHRDDVSNPAGVARLLAEIPHNLRAATQDQLDRAELNLDLIEGRHLERILHHAGRDDANLRAELSNYVAVITPETAAATLVALAADVRYSTYMAGPMGKSLGARFGLDPEIFRTTALRSLAESGTPDQIARSAALNALKDVRRVIGLARGGRDQAVQVVQRPPKREPSAALMS